VSTRIQAVPLGPIQIRGKGDLEIHQIVFSG
jgi:hypothetical protein